MEDLVVGQSMENHWFGCRVWKTSWWQSMEDLELCMGDLVLAVDGRL